MDLLFLKEEEKEELELFEEDILEEDLIIPTDDLDEEEIFNEFFVYDMNTWMVNFTVKILPFLYTADIEKVNTKYSRLQAKISKDGYWKSVMISGHDKLSIISSKKILSDYLSLLKSKSFKESSDSFQKELDKLEHRVKSDVGKNIFIREHMFKCISLSHWKKLADNFIKEGEETDKTYKSISEVIKNDAKSSTETTRANFSKLLTSLNYCMNTVRNYNKYALRSLISGSTSHQEPGGTLDIVVIIC